MAIELFNNGKHVCLMFPDLISDGGEVVQANQFLIVDNGHGMLLDPGGTLTYNDLYLAIAKYFQPKNLDYLFASHADPDVIAALDRWLTGSSTALLISSVWARFMPHLCKEGKTEARIISIPDPGGDVRLGDCTLKMIPAHFMHAEGNFHVYDPVSKILFSGDLGVSLMPPSKVARVLDFDEHISHMRGFHQALHAVEQGAQALGQHGPQPRHRATGAAARLSVHRQAHGQPLHRLDRAIALRHRPGRSELLQGPAEHPAGLSNTPPYSVTFAEPY